MCFHKRLICGKCGHCFWGPITERCALEKAFQDGDADTGCAMMLSHGFHTLRIDGLSCDQCRRKKADVDDTLARLKSGLQALRADLARRLRGATTDGASSREVGSTEGVDSPIEEEDEVVRPGAEVGTTRLHDGNSGESA